MFKATLLGVLNDRLVTVHWNLHQPSHHQSLCTCNGMRNWLIIYVECKRSLPGWGVFVLLFSFPQPKLNPNETSLAPKKPYVQCEGKIFFAFSFQCSGRWRWFYDRGKPEVALVREGMLKTPKFEREIRLCWTILKWNSWFSSMKWWMQWNWDSEEFEFDRKIKTVYFVQTSYQNLHHHHLDCVKCR